MLILQIKVELMRERKQNVRGGPQTSIDTEGERETKKERTRQMEGWG